jgi:hypothetical protein
MNDEDLRDCFAMFALVGAMISNQERTATDIWDIADDMLSARKKEKEEDTGIATVMPKRPRKR